MSFLKLLYIEDSHDCFPFFFSLLKHDQISHIETPMLGVFYWVMCIGSCNLVELVTELNLQGFMSLYLIYNFSVIVITYNLYSYLYNSCNWSSFYQQVNLAHLR